MAWLRSVDLVREVPTFCEPMVLRGQLRGSRKPPGLLPASPLRVKLERAFFVCWLFITKQGLHFAFAEDQPEAGEWIIMISIGRQRYRATGSQRSTWER
jgi:hypothetical protein